MKKLLVSFSLFLSFFLLFKTPTFAAADFTTAINTTYTMNEQGIAHANLQIDLKNLSENYYAASYSLTVGFDDIENLQASDAEGRIVPVIEKNKNGQTISVKFNQPTLGLNNHTRFTISFDTRDIAQQEGTIWEVNIPGVADESDFSDFNVHVVPPASFGKPIYTKPATGGNGLDFSKSQLGKSGISIAFGDKQIYAFTLTYHLRNPNLFPIQTEIALPPTTNYQNIEIDDISPKPTNVIMDQDGNWKAQYTLIPSQTIHVSTRGKAFLSLYPKKQPLTNDEMQRYLQSDQYWQANDTTIKNLAKQLQTPQAIYAFVIRMLHYDFSRVSQNQDRLGAVRVLQQPSSAVCLEFTDLFIALTRAAGIPAREIDGFAYTQNKQERPLSLVKDVLHAWPEYYDKNTQRWIMVDPTWGNTTDGVDYFTTLDFDHFAFVVKGLSSTYPVPAGGYKIAGFENQKDVSVTFGDGEEPSGQFSVSFAMSPTMIAGLPIKGNIIVSNNGSTLVGESLATLSSQTLLPNNQPLLQPAVPPFGYVTIPIAFDPAPFLTKRNETITMHSAGNDFADTITIVPMFLTKYFFIGGGIVVLLAVIIFIIAAKTRRVHVSR